MKPVCNYHYGILTNVVNQNFKHHRIKLIYLMTQIKFIIADFINLI